VTLPQYFSRTAGIRKAWARSSTPPTVTTMTPVRGASHRRSRGGSPGTTDASRRVHRVFRAVFRDDDDYFEAREFAAFCGLPNRRPSRSRLNRTAEKRPEKRPACGNARCRR
jgi:hypothetical protein